MGLAMSDDEPLAALAADASHEIPQTTPAQLRVVALRLQGKRWSQIADELGVDRWTVWHWRQINPEIDLMIATEAADCIDASKHGIARLAPEAVRVLREEMAAPNAVAGKVRLMAARIVMELLKRADSVHDTRGPVRRELAALSDSELDAALDAANDNAIPEGEP
jgi:DNA-binding CsgD family transcriptional regulator